MTAKKISPKPIRHTKRRKLSLKTYSTKREVGTFRLDVSLKKSVNEWLGQNPGINFSRLVNLAVFDYITKPHLLKPVEIELASNEEMLKSLQKMMQQHAETLEQLK